MFVPPDDVENYEGKFIPKITIEDKNIVRNAFMRFLNGDEIFDIKIESGDEDALFN